MCTCKNSIQTDSIRISGDGHPQINYAVPKIGRDLLVVYREESYGSLCCPKDPMWAIPNRIFLLSRNLRKQIS